MPEKKAHNVTDNNRTDDVIIHDDIYFKDLLLSNSTLKGLEASGFKKPSPIQRKAIPLGRCGFDLIVQAKSGTGKTCVFTVVALEMLKSELEKLQVLILSPTREISVQIKDVIAAIGVGLDKLKVEVFIGGMPLENDKKNLPKCQIAVGAPGRVRHLVSEGLMNVDAVRLFVLDEADKLMEGSFRRDISFIYLNLPDMKQVIATSATFSPSVEEFITQYMNNPMRVSPGKDIFLIGIHQFVSVVPSHLSVFVQMKTKVAELFRILSLVPFKQCLVFSNYQSRAESVCNELNKAGWPAVYISGSQSQTVRLKAMSSLKTFRCRVLLSTDLSSRGIDAENVNLIVNLDLPYDGSTYMHRIGRAGRFGTYGLAITIVQQGPELEEFRKMLNGIGGGHFQVSLFPKEKFSFNIWEKKVEDFEQISSIDGEYKYLRMKDLRVKEKKDKECEVKEKKGKECEVKEKKDKECEVKEKKDKECEEKEREVRTNALTTLLEGHFTMPKKPKLKDYDELCELWTKFKKIDLKQENHVTETVNYEEFSSELLSSVIYLEKESWKKYRKMIEENCENSEVESGAESASTEASEEDGFEDNEDGYAESEDDEEVTTDDSDDDNGEGEENVYESEAESEEVLSRDSLVLKKWYSLWYAQLSTIRQYVNWLKYFQHCNEN